MWKRIHQSLFGFSAATLAVAWAIAWPAVFVFDVRVTSSLTATALDPNFSFLYLLVVLGMAGPMALFIGAIVVREGMIRPLRRWRAA